MKRRLTLKLSSRAADKGFRMIRIFTAACLFLMIANVNAEAQERAPGIAKKTSLDAAIERLIPLLKSEIAPDEYFTDSFLSAVPATQFKALTDQLIKEHGQPIRIAEIKRQNNNVATFRLEFEKAVAKIDMTVDPATRKVSGLFLSNIEKRGDSVEKIKADFVALPGSAGYAVMLLDKDQGPKRKIAGLHTSEQFAIGSTFKLYILAELASQVEAGKRNWSDVTPLAHRSFSSLATRNWPKDSPVTLETLALQMIAVSDNSATDTLLHHLGRDAVERRLKSVGHGEPERTLPFLSTVEAFALKGNDGLRESYLQENEKEQRKLLKTNADKLDFSAINSNLFSSSTPKHIDTIEWFASPSDITKLLDNIRLSRNDRMLEIMSVNVGPAESRRKNWNYLGYKGGSEPGVISMSFLAQAKDGNWYAISGSWNDTARAVDDNKFSSLMTRLLDSVSGFAN